jgi:ferredoxin
MIVMTPLGGRFWCMICPMPAIGEWLQRKRLTGVSKKPLGLNKPWPRKLDNIWLQNISFLTVSTFIGILTTRPWATGVMLLLLVIILPVIFHLVFERRAWCRYICPVSGFIGLYSMIAPIELRVKDRDTCLKHPGKECIRGSDRGYGCPWFEFPQNMNRNAYCGLCMECVKTCPLDNIGLYVRIGGEDLYVEPWHGMKRRGLDEPFKAFIMATLAIIYALVFTGPNPWLKKAANVVGGESFGGLFTGNLAVEALDPSRLTTFALIVWGTTLIVTPLIFAFFTALSKLLAGWRRSPPFKEMFIKYSYLLVPLSLMAWIAFAIYILLVNGSYLVSVISDPFGWGWNLFGTKGYPWTPIGTAYLPYIQATILIFGLAWTVNTIKNISRRIFEDRGVALRASIPYTILAILYTYLALIVWLGGLGGMNTL